MYIYIMEEFPSGQGCIRAIDALQVRLQAWSGKQPRVDYMRTFGCIAFAKVPDFQRTKLEPKATKCLFLGYCEGTKTYRLMSVETKKILRSRDVTFLQDSTLQGASVDGPSGRNEDNGVIMDQSTKTPIVVLSHEDEDKDDGEGDASSTLKSKNGKKERVPPSSSVVEGDLFSGDCRYPDQLRRLLDEWWKNHIMTQSDEKHANVALLDGPFDHL